MIYTCTGQGPISTGTKYSQVRVHSKDSWWAKEGDSYDHGRGFIVRILGGLKRETVMTK